MLGRGSWRPQQHQLPKWKSWSPRKHGKMWVGVWETFELHLPVSHMSPSAHLWSCLCSYSADAGLTGLRGWGTWWVRLGQSQGNLLGRSPGTWRGGREAREREKEGKHTGTVFTDFVVMMKCKYTKSAGTCWFSALIINSKSVHSVLLSPGSLLRNSI